MEKKVAVITGGSEGLGKHIAIRLAKEEIKVILLARTEDKLDDAAREINNNGGEAEFFSCDVTSVSQVKNTAEMILKKYSKIDILVNNAGVYFEEPTAKMDPEKIRKMFEVNTLGCINVVQAFLPQFIKQNGGQILAVVSVAGVEISSEWGLYAASKFGQDGFIQSLRKELAATKIKVMGFYPEGIDTGIFKKGGLATEPGQSWMMKPRDVAEVVCFMLTRPDDINLSQVVLRKIEQ